MKETLSQAGYVHVKCLGNGEHLLFNTDGNVYEIWANNKNHANSGLIFKNTHLEFCRTQKAQSCCAVPQCKRCSA